MPAHAVRSLSKIVPVLLSGGGVRPLATCLCALATILTGCERSLQPSTTHEVKGRVVLANGKPLTRGRVVFMPIEGLSPPASGDLEVDGSFTLTTREPGDGAAAGQYKLRVEPASGRGGRNGKRPVFPLKYIDEDSSGVVITVKAGPNTLEPITLK
jgi:hypothetical protein